MSAFDPTGEPILVIDDEEPVRRGICRQLERVGYDVRAAGDAVEAHTMLLERPVALVLCDIDLPGRSGLDILEDIGREHPGTAVVMVTGVDDTDVAQVALDRGAYGYVIKPFERNELRINVVNALRRRALELENHAYRTDLERLVFERTDELRRSREELIQRLAYAADYKDSETASHIERMALYSEILARRAGLPASRCELLRLAAPMHDIGKIGIPDEVLCKPGLYDDEERAIMQRHCEIGHAILAESDSDLVRLAAVVALGHHEWFDGSGYPNKLAGESIPIEARIVAIADVFDALTTKRRYKTAMTMDEARALMTGESGTHFDPQLLELFFSETAELEEIRGSVVDDDELQLA